jgi:hypothetical protein
MLYLFGVRNRLKFESTAGERKWFLQGGIHCQCGKSHRVLILETEHSDDNRIDTM